MFKTTLKNLRARKFRLVTTGIAVILGVAFVAGTLVLTATITRSFSNLFSDVFAGTDAQVRAVEPFNIDNGPGSTRPRVDASLVAEVAAVPGVAVAEGDTFGYAQIVGKNGKPVGKSQGPPTFGGGWSSDPDLNQWTIKAGRAPASATEVIIDAGSAKKGKLALGDRTTILTQSGPVKATIVGIATFGKYDSPGGSTFAGFTPEAAQQYIGKPGKFDSVSVVADKGVSETEVKADIAKVLPKDTEVITGQELTDENKNDVQGFIDVIGNAMLAFALIALFVGTFIIYNTFSILVAQRTREMALLRAIGASRRQVTWSLMLEALVVGFIASVVGLALGVGVAVGLKALFSAFGLGLPAEGLAVGSGTVITCLLLGTIISVLASWLPARRGAKVPPIAAMRDVAYEQKGRPRLRVGIGGVLGILGVVLLFSGLLGGGDGALPKVGFGALLILLGVTVLGPLAARPITALLGRPVAATRGTSGVLARENAMRNPKRTSTTASALMIGVALVVFITVFASSTKASFNKIFSDQFTGDFVMNTNTFGFGGVTPDMAAQLRELPELQAVVSLRNAQAEVDGKGKPFQAFDADQLAAVADIGVEQGKLTDLDAHSFAVLDKTATDKGWNVGTKVPFRFTDGGVQDLTVKVIYSHNELAGNFWVDTSVLDANVADQFDSIVFAKVADGSSIEKARPAVKQVTDQYANVKLQDRKEFIKSQAGFIDVILNLVYVLLALAIIIAVFGIGNTLLLSIVERTRELGLLRAVGMTRSQLKSMVRWEAILISRFGTIGGLGVGTFFGWAMFKALEDQGFKVFQIPIIPLVVIAVLAAVFGVVAAWLPARRAAKLDVLKAIAAD
ncbi:MAG: ABC-type transport system, involved in lipoprotein release, permease component [Actinomycetia bacterium]|nr:ABC-type transport system, involved in lipoprotein release, permease component [Actinomycetes bacterium]